MRADLKPAYELIFQFKSGALEGGSITDEQARLVQVLKEDLDVTADEKDTVKLAKLAAIADSYWNQQTQMTIAKYYGAMSQKNSAEAEGIREAFFAKCPSVWYCGIVGDL